MVISRRLWRALRRYPTVWLGLAIVAVVCLGAALAPWVSPYDPTALDVPNRLSAPSPLHRLGTDDFGRDVWSRILYGARVSVLVGGAVTLVTSVAGVVLGLLAGYYPRADHLIMRLMDGLMAFPAILLAIAIMAALGPHVINVIAALSAVYTPRTVRVVRAGALSLRNADYVQAARALGCSDARILFRHILPGVLSPLVVQATFTFANAVLAEASLSFLGAGVPPEQPSWGGMLAEGRSYIRQAPWMTVYPGLAIALTVLGLNMLGDGVRDFLDPRARKEQVI
ncbi:ABC transporter permease [Caldinitratiruptor microaerophilus]|uniref:Peptide ABC transporter permease n=1 Tax=Caldinitratiruptor microaerophilus TaxID=671077 RepID=A0AA35CID8_9FIRM|nr:ABC transporter permease [Caldinitratiruptor microaerophilus]BDG59527.1 peptide ABC transporter permease [Caldinitratiruptor microaerophilus]